MKLAAPPIAIVLDSPADGAELLEQVREAYRRNQFVIVVVAELRRAVEKQLRRAGASSVVELDVIDREDCGIGLGTLMLTVLRAVRGHQKLNRVMMGVH